MDRTKQVRLLCWWSVFKKGCGESMKILKKLLLCIIKLLIALHAVFWISIDVLLINRLSEDQISLPEFIIMLFIGLFMSLAPMVLYRSVNRRLKFDASTLSPLENIRNFVNKYRYVRRHDALEVFENKDLQWKILMMCLFVLLITGPLMISIGGAGSVFYFFILLMFLPSAIRSFIRIIDKRPFLILTDDAIEFKLWNIDAINYSEIISIDISTSTKVHFSLLNSNNLSDGVIAIKVSDPNKIRIKSSSKFINYLNSIGSDDTLEIFTQIIEHDGSELVHIVQEKMKHPQVAIMKIVNNKKNEPYIANIISPWHRYVNIFLSISVLSYAIYGLIVGNLIIPAKRGKYVELYGLASYVMFLAALFSAAYLLSFVFDHYDKRNNEKIYRKSQRYFYRCAWGTFCCAFLVSGYQYRRDYVCRNEVVLKVASTDKKQTAYVAKRHCALHDPMNDTTPIYGVTVIDAQTALMPDSHFNTASFKGYAVKTVSWEGNALIIEYGPVTTHELKARKSEPTAHVDSQTPVPVRLKKIIP